MQRIFLTGVTGQVGSFVAKQLLQKGHKLWLLVRGTNPHERVRKVFTKLGVNQKNYNVISGDICDLNPSLSKLKIDHFIHCAANVSFEKRLSQEVENININGTQNMLRWCINWQCSTFHYVSTAYVAGKYALAFNETMLDEGQSFRNAYEKSKVLAEKLCINFAAQNNLTLKIYRPGIVMAEQGGITLNYSGLYVILKVLDKLGEMQKKKSCEQLRVCASPMIKKHIIGVDCVAQTIAAMIENKCRKNETLILCTAKSPSIQQIVVWLRNIFNLPQLEISTDNIDKTHAFERMIARAIVVYEEYLNSEPVFDLSYSLRRLQELGVVITDVNATYFEKMVDFGRKDRWGREKVIKPIKTKYHDYFTCYLPQFIDKEVLPNIQNVNSSFAVKIDGHLHYVKIERGIFTAIDKVSTQLDFVYELSLAVFEKMIGAEIDPRAAFFSGKTDITGNIEKGLKIANLLRIFFKTHPFKGKKNNERILA